MPKGAVMLRRSMYTQPLRRRVAHQGKAHHARFATTCLGLAIFVAATLTGCGSSSARHEGSSGALPTVPPGWRLYHEPSGLFTMAIPAAWGVDRNTSTAPVTIYGQTFTALQVNVRLGEPEGGTSAEPMPSASVFLSITHIEGKTQQEAWCHNWKPDTTVGSSPAMRLPPRNLLVATTNAVYQISYTLPNDGGTTAGPPVVPSATAAAAQNAVMQAIASFHPIPPTPLTC